MPWSFGRNCDLLKDFEIWNEKKKLKFKAFAHELVKAGNIVYNVWNNHHNFRSFSTVSWPANDSAIRWLLIISIIFSIKQINIFHNS